MCDVSLRYATFPYGVPGVVWALIVSIPDFCLLYMYCQYLVILERLKIGAHLTQNLWGFFYNMEYNYKKNKPNVWHLLLMKISPSILVCSENAQVFHHYYRECGDIMFKITLLKTHVIVMSIIFKIEGVYCDPLHPSICLMLCF